MGTDSSRLASELEALAVLSGAELTIGELDVEDKQALEESKDLRGTGVFFAISAKGGSGGGTPLWIEAMKKIRHRLGQAECKVSSVTDALLSDFTATPLGRICRGVLLCGHAGGIALVDGGIEEVFVGSTEVCLARMVCDVAGPWDQSPNRLYVCRNPRLRPVGG